MKAQKDSGSTISPIQLKKPTLFIRNVKKIGPKNVQKVMSDMGAERLQINYTTKDVVSDLAVAFFPSEESAFSALAKLRSMKVEGNRLPASFR